MCNMAKVWSKIIQKNFMHKVESKDSASGFPKFVLFHLMDESPFDLPHTIYINILQNMKTLGGEDHIYYATLVNKLLWEYQVFHVFKQSIINKGTFYARQQHFSVVNLKENKVDIKRNMPIPPMDEEDIKKMRQKKLVKTTIDEEKLLQTFSIAKEVKIIIQEQKIKVKTRWHTHQQEEDKEILTKEQ